MINPSSDKRQPWHFKQLRTLDCQYHTGYNRKSKQTEQMDAVKLTPDLPESLFKPNKSGGKYRLHSACTLEN